MDSVRILALLGDGIGPDIVRSAVVVLQEAARKHGLEVAVDVFPSGLAALETHDSTLPPETLEALPSYPGWILGPVSTHLYPRGDPRYINPSGYLRKQFDLYANIRPVRSFQGVPALHSDIDLVIARENTEGFYADRNVLDGNGEFRPDADTVISLRVITRRACLRLARRAFELARQRNGKRRVTAVHKANVLRLGDGLFLDCCREVAKDYPDITLDDAIVDAFAMYLVVRGAEFDVIATTNMFGDILSDEAAGLVGGLGLAASLNEGDKHAMAQAVHGSAPDIAAFHVANPVAEILSRALLFNWLAIRQDVPALQNAAHCIERAVSAVLSSATVVTPDLGGRASTEGLTDAIVAAL